MRQASRQASDGTRKRRTNNKKQKKKRKKKKNISRCSTPAGSCTGFAHGDRTNSRPWCKEFLLVTGLQAVSALQV